MVSDNRNNRQKDGIVSFFVVKGLLSESDDNKYVKDTFTTSYKITITITEN
jgi:hypothetical protein